MWFEFDRKVFHKKKHLRSFGVADMELHDALKKARTNAGLSVGSVAQHLKVGRAQVWRMEKNAEFISVARLRQVADLYGVQLEALLDDTLPKRAAGISYQIVGMAVDAVMSVVSLNSIEPAETRIRDAVIAVVRLQQSRREKDRNAAFVAKEYTALIEEKLLGSKHR